MRNVIGAAEREGHAVYGSAASLQEGDACEQGSVNELAEVIDASVRAFQSDAAEALEDHLHSLNGEHLGGNSLAVRGQERLGSVDQSIDSGCCERLVRQGLEQIRNQANLVRDDVVGNQAELGIAAGQLAVLLVLNDSNRNVGNLRTGTAGGRDSDNFLLMYNRLALEVQLMYGGRALAAEQLAKVHDSTAAYCDYAVVGIVRNSLVHGLDHSLGRLACTELLLEYELALEAKLFHEGLVDEFVGQNDVALAQLELLSESTKGVKLVNSRGNDDLSLVLHQGGAESIHSHSRNISIQKFYKRPCGFLLHDFTGWFFPVFLL